MTRFQFVVDHQERFGVKRLCRVLRIARSSFYHWKATARSGRGWLAAGRGPGAGGDRWPARTPFA